MPSDFSWRITRQQPNQTTNDETGNTIVGTYVYYQTGDGNSGVVFIPDNLYNEKHVTETVRASARLLDKVGRLSEGTA